MLEGTFNNSTLDGPQNGFPPNSSDELGDFFYLNSIINTKINKRIIMAITILEETKNSIKSF